jgi:hypothetical protein
MIICLHRNLTGSGDVAPQSGNAQASFGGDHLFAGRCGQYRIDPDLEAFFRIETEEHKTNALVDLWCGETNAIVFNDRIEHVLYQLLYFGTVDPFGWDRVCDAPKNRMTHAGYFQNRHTVTLSLLR